MPCIQFVAASFNFLQNLRKTFKHQEMTVISLKRRASDRKHQLIKKPTKRRRQVATSNCAEGRDHPAATSFN